MPHYSLSEEDVSRADQVWARVYCTRKVKDLPERSATSTEGGLTQKEIDAVLAQLRKRVTVKVEHVVVARWGLLNLRADDAKGEDGRKRVEAFKKQLVRKGLTWDRVRPERLIYYHRGLGIEGVLLHRPGLAMNYDPSPNVVVGTLDIECPFAPLPKSRQNPKETRVQQVTEGQIEFAVQYDVLDHGHWKVGPLVDEVISLYPGDFDAVQGLPAPTACEFFSGHSAVFKALQDLDFFDCVFRVESSADVWERLSGNRPKQYRGPNLDFRVPYQELPASDLLLLFSSIFAHLSPECCSNSLQAQAVHLRGQINLYLGATPFCWFMNGLFRALFGTILCRIGAGPFYFTLEAPATGNLHQMPLTKSFLEEVGAEVAEVDYCRWMDTRSRYKYNKKTNYITNVPGLKQHLVEENERRMKNCRCCSSGATHTVQASGENSSRSSRIPDHLARAIAEYVRDFLLREHSEIFTRRA